jgi:cysteine-rich repeat protein
MHRFVTIVALAAAGCLAGCGMSSANPRYCDESTPCRDPRWPDCDLVAHQCNEASDAAVPDDAGPPGDSRVPDDAGIPADANPSDGTPPADAPPQVDGGGDAGCVGCSGETPACSGTTCVCTTTSCAAAHPICDTAGTCRTCATHAECVARDPLVPVCATAGTCGPAVCGDNVLSPTAGERCDYGDTQNYDGCDPTCRYTGTVTTIAGKAGGQGYCDANGTDARLLRPAYVATVGSGVYFTEETVNTVRKIAGYQKTVSTLAGAYGVTGTSDGVGTDARFSAPEGVATDGSVVYVADSNNHVIRRIVVSTGATDTIAGAAGQSGTADGLGAAARFHTPYGLALDSHTLYVADRDNCAVRAIDLATSGFPVVTVGGTVGACNDVDGDKTTARMSQVEGVTAVGSGVLYVTVPGRAVIRRVEADGSVSTPYGTYSEIGWADGVGNAARFHGPKGIAYISYPSPALIVADSGNGTIRKIQLSTNMVSTLAGSPGQPGTADGTGAAARFMSPQGVTPTSFGSSYVLVVDNKAGTLRQVDCSSGAVTTYVGSGSVSEAADGTGATARLGGPSGLAPLGDSLLVADSGGNAIRQLSPTTGQLVTLAGSLGLSGFVDEVGPAARFLSPNAITTRGGRVFVADRYSIREFDPTSKAVSTRAGSDTQGTDDGDGTAAHFYFPSSLAADDSFVYISDMCTVRRMMNGSPWTVTTILGEPAVCGATDGVGSYARLGGFVGLLLVDDQLYVADATNSALRRVDLSAAPVYRLDTIAGVLGEPGSVDGVGTNARFSQPKGVAYDGQSLFVVDKEMVRQIDPETMAVSTLLGKPGCFGAVEGDYSHAGINTFAIIVPITYLPSTGLLYMADSWEHVVREIR